MELALVYKDVIDYNTAVYFYFKQNAADELRISDWSSDVCSSDLSPPRCSLSSSRSPEPPAGWPTGSSCWSRSRRSLCIASSTRAWPSATTSAEECSVGKECVCMYRSRWTTDQLKTKYTRQQTSQPYHHLKQNHTKMISIQM